MLTPQEVEERVFPKAKKGGYDMQDVDNFLDQLTADYTELFKENAALKRKMKVLADKITEYQETEGAMRATLLAAQKMGNEIVEEAKAKQAKIIEDTEGAARKRSDELKKEIAELEERKKSLKSSVAAMAAGIRDLIAHEQEFLSNLPAVDGDQKGLPTGEERETIRRTMAEQRDALMAEKAAEEPAAEDKKDEDPTEEAASAEEPAAEEPAAEDEKDEDPAEETADKSTESADEFPTRRLDLSELRFGRNYEIK